MTIRRSTIVLASVGALLVLLTGCVDVVQYISGSGGTIDVYLRLTLQKSAFEAAGSAPSDDALSEEYELDQESVLDGLPEGIDASFAEVNDEFETGFELTYSADRRALAELADAEDAAFVPRVTNFGITIPLGEAGGGMDESGGEADQIAAAFLGGSKYRVFISRMLVSRVSAAYLVSSGERVEVPVLELPDVWMVQFPVSLWILASEPPVLEILF